MVEITKRELRKLVQEEIERRRRVQQEENVTSGAGSYLTPKAFTRKKKYWV